MKASKNATVGASEPHVFVEKMGVLWYRKDTKEKREIKLCKGGFAMPTAVKRPKDMINNSNLGKWMSWADIKRTYPDRWVYITNFEKDKRNNIAGGILEVVCEEPEVDLVKDILLDESKKGYFDRTTELPGNVLWVE